MSGQFPAASPKVRATLYLPQDLLEEARDATVHLGGFPLRLTLTKFAERAFRAELQRLKDTLQRRLRLPAERRGSERWPTYRRLARRRPHAPQFKFQTPKPSVKLFPRLATAKVATEHRSARSAGRHASTADCATSAMRRLLRMILDNERDRRNDWRPSAS